MTDAIDDIVTIINNGWSVATGGTKPNIAVVETYKRIDLGSVNDYILLYGSPANITPIGLGYGSEQAIQSVSIDIRTTTSKTRLLQLLTEVKRIVHVNRTKASNGLHDLIVYSKETPLSNRTIKLWRYIIEVEVKDFANSVP